MSLALDADDRARLEGRGGKAMQLAMRPVVQAAQNLDAERLIPVTFAHVDACFYTGQAHVDFVRFLLENGAVNGVDRTVDGEGVGVVGAGAATAVPVPNRSVTQYPFRTHTPIPTRV